MLEQELTVALAAVRQAAALCQAVQADLVTEDTLAKRDRSPVTVADFGAQALILQAIADRFPDDAVVAEEESDVLRDPAQATLLDAVERHVQAQRHGLSGTALLDAIDRGRHAGGPTGRFWVLDPIDGTKGFIRGEQYAVALGLIENGVVQLGVLGCPNLPADGLDGEGAGGVLLFAVRGAGASQIPLATAEARAVRVSALSISSAAAFCESVESGHSAHGVSARVAEALGITRDSVRLDSQCKYAVVARGEADIYMRLPTRAEYRERIWDHAAGMLVVTEAGGRVTDIDGHPLDFAIGRTLRDNRGVVATNGALHETVIAAIQAALAS